MKTAIKSSRIYCEDGMKSGYLVVSDGKIDGVFDNPCDAEEVFDGKDMRVIPGIFDTHNHGTFGYDLIGRSDDKENEKIVKGYLKALASQGVTNILPTCSTSMFKTVAHMTGTEQDGATILGIHSEGPWLNRVGEKGIKTGWPEVSLDAAKKMVSDGGGHLKLVAAAPEIEGIGEILDYFKSQGVELAYAHSDMNYEEADAAIKKYFGVATHTGNVMTGLHHRDIGGLGACLLNENMDCEIICDGMHLSLEMLEVYFKIKDFSKFMMISDCSGLSGAPVGSYTVSWSENHSMNINVREDGFVLSDTGRICGSSKPVLYGIGNLVEKVGLSMETVLRMSAYNPCKKYGYADVKGSLSPGKDADFVIIDDEYNAIRTYATGRKVFDTETDTIEFNPEYRERLEKTKK